MLLLRIVYWLNTNIGQPPYFAWQDHFLFAFTEFDNMRGTNQFLLRTCEYRDGCDIDSRVDVKFKPAMIREPNVLHPKAQWLPDAGFGVVVARIFIDSTYPSRANCTMHPREVCPHFFKMVTTHFPEDATTEYTAADGDRKDILVSV